jgi:vacuolar-type H+-ATPase subunit H
MASADEEIHQEKEKVRKELDELYTRRVRQAEDEAAKILANARQDAEREKTNIIASAQSEISDMVTAATEKIVLQASASEAFEQFLDAAEGGMDDDSN